MPGLVVCVCLTALVLGPLVTVVPDYLTRPETLAYLRQALLIPGNSRLPGVFPHNPNAGAMDGPLWSIPLEAICYALVVACGTGRRAFLTMFGVLVLAFGCQWSAPAAGLVVLFAFGALVGMTGIRVRVPLPGVPLDLSYGVYLYAYPIQQTVIMLRPEWSAVACFAAALPVTLALAAASWGLIEAPALRLKPRRALAVA